MEIGTRIKELRDKHKMSQSLLAEKLGVSQQTVAGWEKNRNYPRPNKVNDLGKLFSVTRSWLVSGDGNPNDGDVVACYSISDKAIALSYTVSTVIREHMISGNIDDVAKLTAEDSEYWREAVLMFEEALSRPPRIIKRNSDITSGERASNA